MNDILTKDIQDSSTLVELLHRRATAHPDRVMCTYSAEGIAPRVSWTYAEADARARRIGAWLQSEGMAGKTVLLAFPPGLEFIAAFLGCLYAGAIAVPTPPPRRNPQSDRFLSIHKNCQPSFTLTTEDVLERVRAYEKSSPELARLSWRIPNNLDADWADRWEFPQVHQDTIAFLQYTSGSTGDPKGVVVDHGNLLHNQRLIEATFQQTEDMVMVGWLPMHHDMGLVGTLLHPVFLGGPFHMMSPMGFLQKPIRWLQLISETRATISTAPNFAYELCINRTTPEERSGLDLSCLQTALNGAEPVRAATLRRFIEVFEPYGFRPEAFCPCYGMAESTLLICGVQRDDSALEHILKRQSDRNDGSADSVEIAPDCPAELVHCGQPLSGMDVRVVHPETFHEVRDGEIGEVWVSSRSVAKGYWNRPELTREMFQATLQGDKSPEANGSSSHYFCTGDLGLLYQDRLYIAGRLKDVIILNGVNYYPHDLEATAEACGDCFVEGRGVAFRREINNQEEACLVLEVKREYLRQLDDAVLTKVMSEIQQTWGIALQGIYLVKPGSVPVTTSGKVQRQLTKQMLLSGELEPIAHWERPAPESSPANVLTREKRSVPSRNGKESVHELERWMTEKLSSLLEIAPETIHPKEPFARYGFKSQHAVQFCAALEARIHRRVEPVLAYDYPNISELARYLLRENTPRANQEPLPQNVTERAPHEPIAIIGIGCRFPGADNPQEFWDLLQSGRKALRPYPIHRWGNAQTEQAEAACPQGKLPALGGFLDRAEEFDPLFFGISPREVETMDPQQRLALEVCWEALEDAGISPDKVPKVKTGVFMGVSSSEYAHLLAQLNLTPTGYNATGNSLAMTANRISYTLDLSGPSLAFDTACSSSLVAVHHACESLKRGECDVAIAGGVNIMASPSITASLAQAGMLSPTGESVAFASDVDGYVRGEGCGIVVLKRLSDAERDHDRIIAVAIGSAVNHDGRSNGLTAPNGLAQQRVIRQALANAGRVPEDIDYLEVHGTGTSLGDQIEVHSLSRVFEPKDRAGRPLSIGSVKSNIGHLEAAAGIAGLIKVCLALQNQELPRHAIPGPLSEEVSAKSSVAVCVKLTPWTKSDRKRTAGVSSFGFGGTNVHMILEEAPARVPAPNEELSTYLLTLSARSQQALKMLARKYHEALAHAPLKNFCFSANTGRTHFAERLALVAKDRNHLRSLLSQASQDDLSRKSDAKSGSPCPQVVWLLNGVTSLQIGIGEDLYRQSFGFRAIWDQFERDLIRFSLPSLKEILWQERNEKTSLHATLGLFGLQIILGRFLRSLGVPCDIIAADHAGELAALVHADILDYETLLNFIATGNCPDPLPQKPPACGYISSRFSGRRDFGPVTQGTLREICSDRQNGQASPGVIAASGSIVLEFGPSGLATRHASAISNDALVLRLLSDVKAEYHSLCETLAHLYEQGFELHWCSVYDPGTLRISLPTYPFENKPYWISVPDPVGAQKTSSRDWIHPLLHRRIDIASDGIVFETDLSAIADFSDHQVQGEVVFPLAGYLLMAMAAANKAIGKPMAVEELQLSTPIKITPGEACLVQVVLEPGQTGYKGSVSQRSADGWVRHAAFQLKPFVADAGLDSRFPLGVIRSESARDLASEQYSRFSQVGLEYGPIFRTLKNLTSSDGESWATVAPVGQSTAYGPGLHPAMLDGCLQAIASALPGKPASALLPTRLKRFCLLEEIPPGGELYCHVHRILERGQGYEVSLKAYDGNHRLVLFIEDLQLEPLRHSHVGYYRTEWLSRTRERDCPANHIPSLAAFCTDLKTGYRKSYAVRSVVTHSHQLETLDRITSAWAWEGLSRLGLLLAPGYEFDLFDAIQQCGIVKEQQALLGRLLGMFIEDGYLSCSDGTYRVLKASSNSSLPAIPEQPEIEFELFQRCLEHLPSVLRGECDPLTLLFPGDEKVSASRLYTNSIGASALNHLLAESVAQVLEQLPEGRGLKILEVGAGTGATTAFVLNRCGANRIRYTFTDVSPHFLSLAQKRFAGQANCEFKLLDIERPPAAQGFDPETFDIVIAANVLHATSDLSRAVGHVRHLLKPEGVLLLIEGTRRVRWLDVIFGLTQGWWAFRDYDQRPDYPMISIEQWKLLLDKKGFDGVEAISPLGEDCPLEPANSLIISKANQVSYSSKAAANNSWLILGDDETARPIHQGLLERDQQSQLIHWCSEHCDAVRVPRTLQALGCFAHALAQSASHSHPPNILINWPDCRTDAEDVPNHALIGCEQILECVKTILNSVQSRPTGRLVFVTHGHQANEEKPAVRNLAQAALPGFVRSLAAEQPGWRIQLIDLDPSSPDQSCRALIDEMLFDSSELEILFRDGERKVRRLTRLKSLQVASTAIHALRIEWRGTIDGLQIQNIALPKLGPQEIQVQMAACGLNFRDVLNVLGLYPGHPPLGAECTGIVKAIGRDVQIHQVGDRVAVVAPDVFGEEIIVNERNAVAIPEQLSLRDAATIPIAFLTAKYAFENVVRLQPGTRVLIHSAAGGVGLAAIQLAQRADAIIFGTASLAKHSFVNETTGVKLLYDSRTPGFADKILEATQQQGVQVLLNTLGEEFIEENLKALGQAGVYIDLSLSSPAIESRVADVRPDIRYVAVNLVEYLEQDAARVQTDLSEILDRVHAGELRPLPSTAYAFQSAPDAFRFLQAGKHTGKILLTVEDRSRSAKTKSVETERPSCSQGIRAGVSYVISGGGGGLGLEVADYLAKANAACIALLVRRDPTAEELQRIQKLRANGSRIVPLRCDVSIREDVENALEQVRTIAPIAGVIHSAGLLCDAMIANQTAQSFQSVFAPKVHGAWNLHQATLKDDLDHFVLFSSIAGELGSPGQANHAAANTFLDRLAAYRRSLGLKALSINWGPWDQVGAAIRNGASRHAYAGAFEFIPPAQGIQKFAELMQHSEHSQMGVMSFDCSKLPLEAREKPLFEFLRTEPAAVRSAVPCAPQFHLNGKTPTEAIDALKLYLKQKVSRILCLDDAEQLGMNTALFDLGLDSLTTMELKGTLQSDLGIALKPSIFFDYPTLKDLADFLWKTLQERKLPDASAKTQTAKERTIGPAMPSRSESPQTNLVEESSMRRKLIEISNELSQWDDNCCE